MRRNGLGSEHTVNHLFRRILKYHTSVFFTVPYQMFKQMNQCVKDWHVSYLANSLHVDFSASNWFLCQKKTGQVFSSQCRTFSLEHLKKKSSIMLKKIKRKMCQGSCINTQSSNHLEPQDCGTIERHEKG